jgi:hypothetical protein
MHALFAGSAAINSFDRSALSLLNTTQGELFHFRKTARSTAMNSHQFPFATQDWTLAKARALSLQAAQVNSIEALNGPLWITVSGSAQDFFINAGEHIKIPCSHGQVVVEALERESVVRVGQHAEAPRANGQTFAHAAYVSLALPLVRGLRKTADWLDPVPNAAHCAN